MNLNPIIGIIMGSDSDLPVMQEAAKIIEDFGLPYEITIVSAHRTPKRLFDYASNAADRGIKVIIAGAGGAAHLPGMIAAITALPVIGVPIKTNALSGVDSLYSIVQMPAGIPVATVAINGAKNAAILAIQFIGAFQPDIYKKVVIYKNNLETSVIEKAKNLESEHFSNYIQKYL